MRSQRERDGRKVAKFCAKRPRTIKEVRRQLGSCPPWRAKRALDWCREQRLSTENPFLCERRKPYRYGFRNQLVEIEDYTLGQLRTLHTRLGSSEALIEHVLVCTASLSATIGAADRQALSRWRKLLVTQLAAVEFIIGDVEELLTV